jgi:hypothetical protein
VGSLKQASAPFSIIMSAETMSHGGPGCHPPWCIATVIHHKSKIYRVQRIRRPYCTRHLCLKLEASTSQFDLQLCARIQSQVFWLTFDPWRLPIVWETPGPKRLASSLRGLLVHLPWRLTASFRDIVHVHLCTLGRSRRGVASI